MPGAEDEDTVQLAAALALLRSKGFIVPSVAEVQTILAGSEGPVDEDATAEPEFVEWNGAGGASYTASEAEREEHAERERIEYVRRCAADVRRTADDVRAMITGHVRFPLPLADAYSGTMALWVLHTYVYEAQRVTPYLLITSPTSGAGKSTALEVLASLAWRAEQMVNPTAAVVRTVASNGHTVLIDEIDELARSREFTSIANAGYRHGGKVYRLRGGELESYSVFAPKVFAGIARENLPVSGATLDRCVQISLERATQGEAITPFNPDVLAERLARLRERIEGWAAGSVGRLRRAVPDMPALPTTRAVEIWKPLVAVADELGGEWTTSVRSWSTAIEGQKEAAPDPNVRLIQDVHAVLVAWMEDNPHVRTIPVDELVARRNALPTRQLTEQLSPVQFGKRFGRFGIKSQPVKGVRVYRVRDAGGEFVPELADLFARYVLQGNASDHEGSQTRMVTPWSAVAPVSPLLRSVDSVVSRRCRERHLQVLQVL